MILVSQFSTSTLFETKRKEKTSQLSLRSRRLNWEIPEVSQNCITCHIVQYVQYVQYCLNQTKQNDPWNTSESIAVQVGRLKYMFIVRVILINDGVSGGVRC